MQSKQSRPKLAAVVTVYRKYSHAQHIVDRFLDGYGWNGAYHHPPMDLISLYVDQTPPEDLSRERASRHPALKIYPTTPEALTCGSNQLAVGGVIVVGEHGEYPRNEKGQTEYPRYRFFEEIIKTFHTSNGSVPVFNDKHLSWNWTWAKQMYDTSRNMDFAFMAGSSLPVTSRIPSVEIPLGSSIREALCVCYGGVDSYDFHGLETIQCMVERRRGGETGVRWIRAYRGDSFWKAMNDDVWSYDLMQAALSRSHTLTPARPRFNDIFPSRDEMRTLVKDPVAYTYQHNDGLRCTMLLMNGLVRDFNFAAKLNGSAEIFSSQLYLPMPDGRTTLANFFSPLVFEMERMFLSSKAPYPIERTLLTTGLTGGGVESLYRNQSRIDTPHLAIAYQPGRESTFERA